MDEDMKEMEKLVKKSVEANAAKEDAAVSQMKKEIAANKVKSAEEAVTATEKKIEAAKEEMTIASKKAKDAKKAEDGVKEEAAKKEK